MFEAVIGEPVTLEFEKEELTKERMRELMTIEIAHFGGPCAEADYGTAKAI